MAHRLATVVGVSVAVPARNAEEPFRARRLLACDPEGSGRCTAPDLRAPSYSADGRRIVFDAGAQIAFVDADGSDLTLVPAVTADDGDPAFARRHSDRLHRHERRRGDRPLHPAPAGRSGAAGRSERREARLVLSQLVTSGLSPDWSPDGRRLVLVRPPAPQRIDGKLHVGRPSGLGLHPVRAPAGSDPVWSPDGRSVAFELTERGVYVKRFGRTGLRIVAASQIGDTGSHSVFDPAWRPLPR